MWDFFAHMCPDLGTEEGNKLDQKSATLDNGEELTVTEMRSALVRLAAENKRYRNLHKKEMSTCEELSQQVQDLQAECDHLQKLNDEAQESSTAGTPADVQALQAQLQAQDRKLAQVKAEAEETPRILRQKIEELELEVQRLNTTIASREAVASSAERQRKKQIEEREKDLEAKLQEVQRQVMRSLEMQEQLVAERKENEEEKKSLEAEVLRQQDAAAELQKVIESFFPDDVYAAPGLTAVEGPHRQSLDRQSLDRNRDSIDGFSMHRIDEHQEGIVQTSDPSVDSVIMRPRQSLDIRHSLDYSRSRRSSTSRQDTDEIIQHLHARLNNIAVMWKAEGSPAIPTAQQPWQQESPVGSGEFLAGSVP